ncbi:hypothetical protein DPMN_136684 [Dreissena polymorpha]|uniref:Uncharacterized protein n=1 Tax=Dreissena polymorpha TaxID=45954 RepID=A0A9D4G3T0_DREPO|nr:hypothetical protein DPMN_136684 [Dreissena polymorpha]
MGECLRGGSVYRERFLLRDDHQLGSPRKPESPQDVQLLLPAKSCHQSNGNNHGVSTAQQATNIWYSCGRFHVRFESRRLRYS